MRKLLLLSLLASATSFADTDYFVSPTGGDWSSPDTWWLTTDGKSPATAPAPTDGTTRLRMFASSGTLNVDTDTIIANISSWGKTHTVNIESGVVATIGKGAANTNVSNGLNIGENTLNIIGDGIFKGGMTYASFTNAYGALSSSSVGNVLSVYGGKGGIYNISSNAQINGIVFVPFTNSSTYDNKGATINFLGNFSTATSSALYIKGLNATTPANVNFKGTAAFTKEIIIQNYANVTIDTDNFTTTQWIGVLSNSTLKLVGKGSRQYNVSAKVRLNGNATLILEGDNVYKSGSATRINVEGDGNKLVVNGSQNFDGLCLVGSGSAVKTFYIDLTNTTSLELTHLTVQPGAKNYLKTDSLTECCSSWVSSAENTYTTVDNFFIEFINFENGKVKLTNDLLKADDWAHVKAEGWENFRLENGYITATEVVPEPAEWAMIFGGIALAFVMYRRRA